MTKLLVFTVLCLTVFSELSFGSAPARCQVIPKSPGSPKGYVTVELAGEKVSRVLLFEQGHPKPLVVYSLNPAVRMGHNVFTCYPNDNYVSPIAGADVFSLCGGEGLVGQMTLEIQAAGNHEGFVDYMMDLPKRGIVEGRFGLSACQTIF